VEFRNETTGESIVKTRYGDVVLEKPDGVIVHYEISGVIHLSLPAEPENLNNTDGYEKGVYATFYSDGSIEVDEPNATLASIQIANLPDYATYEQLQSVKPLKDVNETANKFVTLNQDSVNYLGDLTTVLSSDYALYWFDYLTGYDIMLGHLGWNHTFSQQIALLRGAAKLQNKDWGVVVTWKYSRAPYLDSGPEIFNQLKDSYKCGAKYFVVFNYYNDDSNPYGTMQDEHFEAVESFWNDVVKNPNVVHGSVSADSVLVLPENYGWGTRAPTDKIWGIFKPDDKTQQIWNLMQSVLADHGLQTDIVYEDENFPLAPEYTHIYYWNQTYVEFN
ncbi:MAG: hypothetical protein NWF03_04195, partial [Candidatus Bathyarchaeota archaeon]|nr:hypothetical protein [Candidatus Bathyarchaeota archaeon]